MDLKTLQKLRFFLAAAFPLLARLPPFTAKAQAWLEGHPRLKGRLDRLAGSQVGAGVRRFGETMVVGDYADDGIDRKLIPPGTMGTLRGAVVLAVLLCLLVPLAMTSAWPALSLEQISGVAGEPVAGWSVGLWMLAAALAWACLLVGTGLANRFALPPALAVFVYFNLVMSAALPRSWWGLALFLIAVVAIVGGEIRAAARADARTWPGIVVCILNGMMAGFVGLATSPIGALFKGRVLYVGSTAGAAIGLLLWWLARRLARRAPETAEAPPPPWQRADVLVGLIAGLHLVYTTSLTVRGGWLVPAQGLHPLAVQMPGYLWPLYYFIGVGVIFKLLRQTKLIHGTVQSLVPPRVLVPLGLTLLLVATAVAWSDPIVLQPGRAWLPGMRPAAAWIASVTPWLWRQPLWGLTMEWARWVFVIVLVLAGWAAVRRRLNGELMAMLLFTTVLLWLAIGQYFLEFSGFGKSRQSAASVMAFALFILWLSHMTLRKFLAGDSAWWPRDARVVLYGAGLMLVLLPVHARAAMHDPKLAHEILLYLFFGILDLGLPFYLCLYASRHFQRLPFSAAQLLGCFGLGAALSVPFTILDKLAVSHWSFGGVWATVNAQVESILQQGRTLDEFAGFLPPAWIVVRALLLWSAILAIGVFVHRRMAGRELAPAVTVFAIVALATGMACFANRALELPLLPSRVVQLITPLRVSRTVDVALVARYLSFVVPALVIGLALIGNVRRGWRAATIGAAVIVHLTITWLWPAQEPWLRSTGLLATAGAAGAIALFVLVVIVRDRLTTVLLAREKPGGALRLLTPGELRVAACLGFAGLGGLSVWQMIETRLVTRRVLNPEVLVSLPALWRNAPATSGVASWHGPMRGTAAPFLTLTVRPCEGGNTRAVLQAAAKEGAQQLSGFTIVGLEKWDQFQPGAIALEFQFERQVQGMTVPVTGTAVVARAGADTALVFTVLYELGDRDRRWDIARALRD